MYRRKVTQSQCYCSKSCRCTLDQRQVPVFLQSLMGYEMFRSQSNLQNLPLLALRLRLVSQFTAMEAAARSPGFCCSAEQKPPATCWGMHGCRELPKIGTAPQQHSHALTHVHLPWEFWLSRVTGFVPGKILNVLTYRREVKSYHIWKPH